MESDRVIPDDVLDDLCRLRGSRRIMEFCLGASSLWKPRTSRFVINVPEEERSDLIRICFQIESAHWFFLDFYSKQFPNKKPCGFREFTHQVFKHIPFLQPFIHNVDEIIDDWKDYKFCVPTFGAILLDEDLSHVLLVQSYRSSWGFPKGKVNKDEPPYQCAIREVYEETGFDISELIDTNEYLEANVNDQAIRLYIIPGVKRSVHFVPKTRNEIKAVNWFPIYDLPFNKKDAISKQTKVGVAATTIYNTFYMVSPFLRKIRQWIFENRVKPRREHLKSLRQRNRSCSDMDNVYYRGRHLNFQESVEMLRSYKDAEYDDFLETDTFNTDYNGGGQYSRKSSGDSLEGFGGEKRPMLSSIKEVHNTYNFVSGPPPAVAAKFDPHILENFSSQSVKNLFDKIRSEAMENKAQRQSNSPFTFQQCSFSSNSSAFTKVNKTKVSRRKRGKKVLNVNRCGESNNCSFVSNENIESNFSLVSDENIESNFSFAPDKNIAEKQSLVQENPGSSSDKTGLKPEIGPIELKLIEGIPEWLNFKFDVDAIIRSMEAAVIRD